MSWSNEQARRRWLPGIAFGVVVAHAVILTVPTIRPAPAPTGAVAPPVRLFHVRPVSPEGSPAVSVAPAAAPSPQEAPPAPPPPPAPREQPAAPLPAAPAPLAAASEPMPAASAAAAADAPYLPRAELSVAPKLLAPVDVAFPEGVRGLVRLQVRATLFIDEEGVVRRVRVDTPDVHPSFERAILESFSSARFSPGQLQDAAVRSQLRIEVEFNAPSGSGR